MVLVTCNISRQFDSGAEGHSTKEQRVVTTNSPLPAVVLFDGVDDHVRRHIDDVVALLRRCRLTSLMSACA